MQILVAGNVQDRQLVWILDLEYAPHSKGVAPATGRGLQSAIVRRSTQKILICLALVAITWGVFGQTLDFGFVNYDDPVYVSENRQIQKGLNWQNVRWAFTHVHSHNWHPLTTISHMFDAQVFGERAGRHHFMNVFLHCFSALFLFVLLAKMTGALWRSAFIAAIFAIHPLHVESVAWVSERKDVLSGLFFMLTLLGYVHYTVKPSAGRYLSMAFLFTLGLLSKPMLVTVPTILLLLDYWPLQRMRSAKGEARSEEQGAKREGQSGKEGMGILSTPSVRGLVWEKIPLFVLAMGSGIATLIAQRGGILQTAYLPFSWRVGNAALAYLIYVGQMFWPANLAVMYPHPGRLAIWETGLATALLIFVTALAFVFRKRLPYFITGWLWYLIMLVPVIGLVQVGSQAHADRYTYLPQIGLVIAMVWGVTDLLQPIGWRRQVYAVAAPLLVMILGWRAWIQTSYWRDTERLWTHTLAVTGQNDFAHFGLGEFLLKAHRLDDAIAQFNIVLATHPNDPDANFQMGYALMEKGETHAAISRFEQTLKVKPEDPNTETNLGNLLLKSGRIQEAVEHYRVVVRRDPSSPLAHYNLAVGLHQLRQLPEAIAHYKEALALDPKYPDAEEFLRQAESENGEPTDSRQP